jgi:hypothetical protein
MENLLDITKEVPTWQFIIKGIQTEEGQS